MRQWLVDAFASAPFTGNPAAVVEPFDAWPDSGWMQKLAQENAVSETAFLLATSDPTRFGLRWMTPALEVPLCGHATLAAAHVLFAELGLAGDTVTFDTLSGPLVVRRVAAGYAMDFPADPPEQVAVTAELEAAFGVPLREVWAGGYLVVLVDHVDQVTGCTPDIAQIAVLGREARRERGNIAIACLVADPATATDATHVVSRFFAPGSGITEDPVTGSLHCILSPLFSGKTGVARLRFRQAFPGRGGDLICTLAGDRVLIEGQAVTVLDGVLRL
jgi:PhzF family phenazine biosynthesis protein